jgi:hypothetical protein
LPVRFLSFSNDSGLCADAVRSYTKNQLVRTLSPSVNLFRAAAFSRQMSLFFKYHINGLLQGLWVSIVYAGGDDVFLVGAWNHTLQAALRISDAMPWRGDAFYLPKPIAASTSPAELSTVERKAVKKLAWIPASKFDRYTASLHSGTYPLDELDQSILNRYAHPITKDALLEAIAEFSRFYQDAFLSHFPQGHPVANIPDTPHLILGGGTGFLSKTVGYPYLKDDYAAVLFKSRCSCSMHPCRRSYRVGPSG